MRLFSRDEVEKIVFAMKNTSAGSDSLNLLVLKITFPYVADILTSLINLCLKRGTFPDCLKTAKITPVFKGGHKNDLGNYRPISVLPVISRVLEKCINTRVYGHLELRVDLKNIPGNIATGLLYIKLVLPHLSSR